MIQGHGDDTHLYAQVRANFSSNIFAGADMSPLKDFLKRHIDTIDNYPEPDAQSLAMAIARQRAIDPACVLVTSGATEAIYLVAQALSHAGYRRFHVKHPTFSEYADASLLVNMHPAEQPAEGCVSWVCNPNNPTGSVMPTACLPTEGVLVVDQSYEDFTLEPLMSPQEAIARRNVWQIHSLTKTYAVPGLRIGYVVSSQQNIDLLRRFTRPWAVNALAIAGGRWLVGHDARAVDHVEELLAEAQRLRRELNSIDGITVFPTQTNFMLARIEHCTAAELKDYLARKHRLLIRDASNFGGLDSHYFRISTQRPTENDLLLQAVRAFAKR